MDKREAADLTELFKHLHLIPQFHKAHLFTEEVVELVGFQIQTRMNTTGRLVYSLMGYGDNFTENLQKAFMDEFGYTIPNKAIGDIENKPMYPATGSDCMYDLSPSTITTLLRLSDDSNSEDNAIPVFVMNIMDVADKWVEQCRTMENAARKIHDVAEVIYENLL